MRTASIALLALAASASGALAGERTVRDTASFFEVTLPEELEDWIRMKTPDRSQLKAHFRSVFGGEDGSSFADLWILVRRLSPNEAGKPLADLAARERFQLELRLSKVEKKTDEDGTLAGLAASRIERWGLLNESRTHLTAWIARRSGLLYVFFVQRFNKAVGDEDLESEVESIRKTLTLLPLPKKPAVEAPKPKPAVDPEALKPRTFRNRFWRVEIRKPEGWVNKDPATFDKSERQNGVILRFDGRREQSFCMVRVYAHLLPGTPRRSAQDWARLRQRQFEERTEVERRGAVEVSKKWRPKGARRGFRHRFVALAKVRQTRLWYFAEGRNERVYEIEIFVTGAHGERVWKKQIATLVDSFRPLSKSQAGR